MPCPLDVVPPALLKDVFDIAGPSILSIINSSLATGTVPTCFKHAVVQPLLKKNQLGPHHAYTKSALLKVYNYLLLSIDSGDCAILLLLDLRAAFDIFYHDILIDRLKYRDPTRFYPRPHSFLPHFPSAKSFKNMKFPSTVDTKFFPCPIWPVQSDESPQNLQLNESKSGVVLFGPPDSIKLVTNSLGNLSTLVKPHVKNLGVIFESAFKFDKQVNSVVKASFFQLCTIAKIMSFLSSKDLEKVVS
ncbi:hypothetical protein N1851_026575 [Merluccius polli]|uniref:Reverse transcriptase domain-containing protein n=1 Tax=Merluccius polli TaxID=89951 RepID=A0AA47MBV7_MERPO|nr:hypothetical protein N1851_026570 [Merluccius polli]KAK0137236.1 hypothetical protein N1851_026575 [Merluccius polli]